MGSKIKERMFKSGDIVIYVGLNIPFLLEGAEYEIINTACCPLCGREFIHLGHLSPSLFSICRCGSIYNSKDYFEADQFRLLDKEWAEASLNMIIRDCKENSDKLGFNHEYSNFPLIILAWEHQN